MLTCVMFKTKVLDHQSKITLQFYERINTLLGTFTSKDVSHGQSVHVTPKSAPSRIKMAEKGNVHHRQPNNE